MTRVYIRTCKLGGCIFFLKLDNPGLFLFIFVFSNTTFTEKTVGVSRIRTPVIRLEGEYADYLTTTTAPL